MTITKKEIEQMLKKQEESIINYMSGNTTLLMEKIDKLNNRMERIEERLNTTVKEVDEIKESIDFTQEIMDKKITDMHETQTQNIEKLKSTYEKEITAANKLIGNLAEKLRSLEDRSRRNNLRIDGIEESEKETWKECETKINGLFKNRLGLDKEIIIERAHRVGKANEERPRTIVLKLLNFKDKEDIMKSRKKLKNTGIYIDEDFSEATMKIRKDLRKQMKEERAKGMYSIISYDKLVTKKFKSNR